MKRGRGFGVLTARATVVASVVAAVTVVAVVAVVSIAIVTMDLEGAMGPTRAAVCAVIVSTVRASMEIPALAVCIHDAFAATIPVLAKMSPRSVLLLLVPGRRVFLDLMLWMESKVVHGVGNRGYSRFRLFRI